MGEDIMDTILKRYSDDLMDDNDYLEETVYRRKLNFGELDYNGSKEIAVESNSEEDSPGNPEQDSPISKWR